MQSRTRTRVLGHQLKLHRVCLLMGSNSSSKENSSEQFNKLKMIIRVLIEAPTMKQIDILPCQLAQDLLVAGRRRDDYQSLQNVLMTLS